MKAFKPPQPAPSPAEPDPIRIPAPDDEDVERAARKRRESYQATKQGRTSTQLSRAQPTYMRSQLG